MTEPFQDLEVAYSRQSPAVDREFRGIRIALDKTPGEIPQDLLWLYGTIQLDQDQAQNLHVTPVQRAVVLTANAGIRVNTWNLVGDKILFPDDQHLTAGFVQAYFKTNVFNHFRTDPHETGYLIASMGSFTSNVVRWGRSLDQGDK